MIFVAQWQGSEVGFPGEVDFLCGFSGRPTGTHNPVRRNGAKVL